MRLNNTSGDADAGSDMVIGCGTLAGSGDADMDGDIVAGSVTLATPGGSILHTDNGRGDEDQGRQSSGGGGPPAISGGNQPPQQPPAATAPRPDDAQHDSEPAQQRQSDDLEEKDWWRALTAGQQEAMMKRFLLQPPHPAAAAPVPATVYVTTPSDEQTRRRKMKSHKLEPFKGTSGESVVEAWSTSIPEAVQRQEDLGGETWSATELYSGATEHLKEGANKRLLKLTESMTPEDRNITYLIKAMRKKYGRREDIFQIQQRSAARVQQPGERLEDYANSLSNLGFGMQLDAVSYIGAFINGINNEQNASQVRASKPKTLEDAVHFAEDNFGEFGEGFKVTDWRVARRRYREPGGEDARQPARSKEGKAAKAELANKFDWAGLGLGFGGEIDSPPTFDTKGKPDSGLVKNLKKDPFSLAALTLIVNQRHTDGSDEKPAAAGRSKTARALEVKAGAEDHLIAALYMGEAVEEIEEDEGAGKDVEAVVVSRTTGPRTEDP
ncbi:hypothetical protein PF011_g24200 [Phytophthora fragariae]|uniref:Retrotransposon gag domain-containing protein n=2 Tax=Phytophthora fragariae TaxID=53985 RepID=A0A6A3I1J5_9STRA|nr:hypothetical protein PF011_g24200 [Phytophthora fragariae]